MSRIKNAVDLCLNIYFKSHLIFIKIDYFQFVSYLLPLLRSSAPLPSFPVDPISSSRTASVELCSIPEIILAIKVFLKLQNCKEMHFWVALMISYVINDAVKVH